MNVAEKESRVKTVAITTLGCRANQYDSSAMEDIVRGGGLQVVSPRSVADVYIINTCTVTGSTDAQSRQEISRLRRKNNDAVIIVTGCYAEVSANDVAKIEGVDYVLGNPEKSKVLECIEGGRDGVASIVAGSGEGSDSEDLGLMTLRTKDPKVGRPLGRTRANLKIQDGCDRTCSFCIIPKARGASRSVPAVKVLEEIRGFSEAGFREVILTGIHLGGYGRDLLPETSMVGLLREIEALSLPLRVRVSSLDPDEVTTEVIGLLAVSKSICNHMHLALQSGSDNVLKAMHRPYTAERFVDVVNALAKEVKDISIGADVIVGFPGETDDDFNETCGLVEALPLSYLHVFPYSERSGTEATTLSPQIDGRIIKERAKKLRVLGDKKLIEFYGRFIGKDVEVLVESGRDKKSGSLKGRTSNYIPVLIDGDDTLKGSLLTARLIGDGISLKGIRGILL